MLRFFLFGPPRLEHNGQIVPLRRTKALALLAHIVMTGQPQDRETLLALLWPEFDAASARNNLRRELSLLKTTIDEDILTQIGCRCVGTRRRNAGWTSRPFRCSSPYPNSTATHPTRCALSAPPR